MNLANLMFRLFHPRHSAEFNRAVERLHQIQAHQSALTRADIVTALRVIATRKPMTQDELTELEAESFALGERIRESTESDAIPHLVWHFLSDADIRYKDEVYREWQLSNLERTLATWEGDDV